MFAFICYVAFCGNVLATIMDTISFDTITTEAPGDGKTYSIGWVKVFGCTEGHDSSESTFTYAQSGNANYMKQIAPYAVSVKIVPSKDGGLSQAAIENYAVFSKICSNPVVAVNHLKEASFTTNVNTLAYSGLSNLNNWYGSTEAKERLKNSCDGGGILRPFTDIFYHACGNVDGIHINPVSGTCEWEWEETFGANIDVYFGFDASKNLMCDGKGTGRLAIIPVDNIGWLKLFDCSEGRSELINGIHLNSEYSKAELRDYLQYAISIKILARGNSPGIFEESNYAVTSALCNPSVRALNNGKETSFELDTNNKIVALQDINTWYGTNAARARLSNSCYGDEGTGGEARDVFDVFYHACGNHGGVHIIPASKVCEWDHATMLYRDIEVWIAYDVNQEKCCTDSGSLGACASTYN